MKKIFIAILYYLLACPLILIIHKWSPTDMAGPGLDLVIYFFAIVISIVLMIRSLIKLRTDDKSTIFYLLVNAIGTLGVILVLFHEGS